MFHIIPVAAAIIVKDNRVLLARRAAYSHLAGLWEFPGGKIETGENPVTCLQRELVEELQIKARAGEIARFDESFYEYGAKRVLLYGMTVRGFEGVITPLEHEGVRWMTAKELETAALAPADVPFARRLRKYGIR